MIKATKKQTAKDAFPNFEDDLSQARMALDRSPTVDLAESTSDLLGCRRDEKPPTPTRQTSAAKLNANFDKFLQETQSDKSTDLKPYQPTRQVSLTAF